MNPRLAVVTLVDGRPDHLLRHVWGLRRQERVPDLHVVVAPDATADALLSDEDGPWATLVLPPPGPEGQQCRGAARDAAFDAAAARGVEVVVSLDAACIPAAGLVDRYARVLEGRAAERPVITCGEVRHLEERTMTLPVTGLRWSDLESGSRLLPAGARAEGPDRSGCGRPSWSASFATTTRSWRALGGFADGDAAGDGEVDADFGRRLGAAGGTMLWLGGAVTYRQPGGDVPGTGGGPAGAEGAAGPPDRTFAATVHPKGPPRRK
jgi:hypothetical protein